MAFNISRIFKGRAPDAVVTDNQHPHDGIIVLDNDGETEVARVAGHPAADGIMPFIEQEPVGGDAPGDAGPLNAKWEVSDFDASKNEILYNGHAGMGADAVTDGTSNTVLHGEASGGAGLPPAVAQVETAIPAFHSEGDMERSTQPGQQVQGFILETDRPVPTVLGGPDTTERGVGPAEQGFHIEVDGASGGYLSSFTVKQDAHLRENLPGVLPHMEQDNVYTGVNDGSLLGITEAGGESATGPNGIITGIDWPEAHGVEGGGENANVIRGVKSEGPEFDARTSGSRDLGIELGPGGTLTRDETGPDLGDIGNIVQKRTDSALTEVAFPKLDGSDKGFASMTKPFADGLVLEETGTPTDSGDADETARNIGPGHQGDGFMMQDGELYPRGILPFMEGQNFTGSDEQMRQLLDHLQSQGLIDTSTGEIVWADEVVAQPQFGSSDDELGALVSWLKDNRLIDTSTGEIVWARQPADGQWFVPEMDSDQSGMRTTGPGHPGQGFMMQDGELYPRGIDGAQGPLKFDGAGGAASQYDGGDTATHERLGNFETQGIVANESQPGYTATDDLWKFRDGTQPEAQYNPKEIGIDRHLGLDNNFDQQGSLAGFKSLSGLDSETERVQAPDHPHAAGILPFMEQSNVLDSSGSGTFEQISGEPGEGHAAGMLPFMEQSNIVETPDHGLDALKASGSEVAMESLERGTAGVGDDANPQHFSLPEVGDEVLADFSALDTDADAPTTLVDLHTQGAEVHSDLVTQHVDIPHHMDPGHHDLPGDHGHGHESLIDHLPDINL